jgi:hypothetical protein
MGRACEVIDQSLAQWMEAQPVFFVATAPLSASGLVNCSPKGNRDEFVVVGERTVAYLEQTGSGIETIAHLRENGRILVMFCAFSGPPRIPRGDGVGVRSIIVIEVSRVADSCGYGVPIMSFEGHRKTMDQWSTRKGPEGIRDYRAKKNARSIDQLDGIVTTDPHRPGDVLRGG